MPHSDDGNREHTLLRGYGDKSFMRLLLGMLTTPSHGPPAAICGLLSTWRGYRRRPLPTGHLVNPRAAEATF